MRAKRNQEFIEELNKKHQEMFEKEQNELMEEELQFEAYSPNRRKKKKIRKSLSTIEHKVEFLKSPEFKKLFLYRELIEWCITLVLLRSLLTVQFAEQELERLIKFGWLEQIFIWINLCGVVQTKEIVVGPKTFEKEIYCLSFLRRSNSDYF